MLYVFYVTAQFMNIHSFDKLFAAGLHDLYDAESQLMKALPKMADAATTAELKNVFKNHFDETEEHLRRLQEIFAKLSLSKKRKKSVAMKGLLEEASRLMKIKNSPEPKVVDVGLIYAAKQIEQYELGAYGAYASQARFLGYDELSKLLEKSGEEEGTMREKLMSLAETIMRDEIGTH